MACKAVNQTHMVLPLNLAEKSHEGLAKFQWRVMFWASPPSHISLTGKIDAHVVLPALSGIMVYPGILVGKRLYMWAAGVLVKFQIRGSPYSIGLFGM